MRLSEFIPVFLSSRSLSVSLHMPTCHMTLFSVTYPFVYTLLLHPFIPPTTIVRQIPDILSTYCSPPSGATTCVRVVM